jgi:hypothetical protein
VPVGVCVGGMCLVVAAFTELNMSTFSVTDATETLSASGAREETKMLST